MAESFPHLPLPREEPVTEKRSGRPPIFTPPADPRGHGQALQQSLEAAINQADTNQGGFDNRRLFRFTVEKGFDPDSLRHISPEIEFISQENEQIIIAFVSDAAIEAFEARLASLMVGDQVTYKQVLYALRAVDSWGSEDRKGWALRREGVPPQAPFLLDVELWPLEDSEPKRLALWQAFEHWLAQKSIAIIDKVNQIGLSLYRLRCFHDQTEQLLNHRDVRMVDLPPRFGIELTLLGTSIQDFPEIRAPLENAPGIAILDSGLTTGHPLLAPAVGDAQSFLPGKDATDEHGHGTLVAGLALYGDVETALRMRDFTPSLRVFSGRILDEHNENATGFVERQIEEAVRYFHDEYGCRVFNLSFGDRNKPYLGGHVKGVAYTLDTLSRELGILFVVSAGNVPGSQLDGLAWRTGYPAYLCTEEWAIIDPATALNVLTVGSIARHDRTRTNIRNQDQEIAEIPLARTNEPSPFTRRGPSAGGAIKPDLVAYGGNWMLNARAGANYLMDRGNGLGELSTSYKFAEGFLIGEYSGTSFAAPHVAHLAARLLIEQPNASPNLLRALLVAHATIPHACTTLLENHDEIIRNICGYGMVDTQALFRSLINQVTLLTEARIPNKRHHFYEIPVPRNFMGTGRRPREITVALSYMPHVRSTRMTYKATRIDFKVVSAPHLEHVVTMFNRATDRDDYENIQELKTPNVSARTRGRGTVQAATWRFTQFTANSILRKKRLFVVVTRNDHPWGELHSATEEPYSLVVCMRDRENAQLELYPELRTLLQTRARARARV